jgi:4a-hydroxytetrahydrobiopterin dehydratase
MKLNEFGPLDERKRKKQRSRSDRGGTPYYGYYYGYGYDSNNSESGDSGGGVEESRSRPIEDFKPSNKALNDLKSRFLPDWEMIDHKTLQAKYVAKDHRHALEFVKFINQLSEKMDHFAEVTQDVAEVAVKTATFDVKGLTILDFQLAMRVDAYAEKHDIDQIRMQGNFGMHP